MFSSTWSTAFILGLHSDHDLGLFLEILRPNNRARDRVSHGKVNLSSKPSPGWHTRPNPKNTRSPHYCLHSPPARKLPSLLIFEPNISALHLVLVCVCPRNGPRTTDNSISTSLCFLLHLDITTLDPSWQTDICFAAATIAPVAQEVRFVLQQLHPLPPWPLGSAQRTASSPPFSRLWYTHLYPNDTDPQPARINAPPHATSTKPHYPKPHKSKP